MCICLVLVYVYVHMRHMCTHSRGGLWRVHVYSTSRRHQSMRSQHITWRGHETLHTWPFTTTTRQPDMVWMIYYYYNCTWTTTTTTITDATTTTTTTSTHTWTHTPYPRWCANSQWLVSTQSKYSSTRTHNLASETQAPNFSKWKLERMVPLASTGSLLHGSLLLASEVRGTE